MTRASAQLPASPAPASRNPRTPRPLGSPPCSGPRLTLAPGLVAHCPFLPVLKCQFLSRCLLGPWLGSGLWVDGIFPDALLPPAAANPLSSPRPASRGTQPLLPRLLKATLTHGRFRIAGGAPSPAQSQEQRKQSASLQCPANPSGVFCKDAPPTGPSLGCASCHPQALLPPAFLPLLSPPGPRGGPHTHLSPPTRRGKTAVSPSLGFSHPGCDGS